MKRFLVLFAMMALCVGVANAQGFIYEHNNEIGIYTTPDPTAENAEEMAVYTGAPGGSIMGYVVLTNPWNENTGTPIAAVGGFEFKIVLPANVFLLSAALPPATTNFASVPEFLCGANIPVVDDHCTLITLTLFESAGTPSLVFITPVEAAPQSVPGNIAITDFNDDFTISVAHPVSGAFDSPVFGLWSSVVASEDASWGEVKSLFR
ncbi:MAG: hypothetical protein ABR506_06235 [Candidatus Krumholzibacteriia bacterium]